LGLTAQTSRDIRRAGGDREVIVEVEFRGRMPSGGLRHPALKVVRTG
jgi:hypothetical protein